MLSIYASELTMNSFKPSNYNLSISGIKFFPSWTYEGIVTISGAVEGAKEIVLNTHQLKVYDAELKTEVGKTEGSLKTTDVKYEEEHQRAKLLFDQDFPASQNAELVIRFQGTMNSVSYLSI